jgi:hypothetical protein
MNEFLFDRYEIAYIASHYIYTDHAQTWTGSAAVSYLWNGTRYSADVIYGSGPRNDFANTGHLPLYTQVNAGISHEFKLNDLAKPATCVLISSTSSTASTKSAMLRHRRPAIWTPPGLLRGLSQKF